MTGASGAGKTTLLRLIFREEVPSSGQILVNGRNVASIPQRKIPYLRRTMGVVFQDFRLIARKTVFENVSYLPRILGVDLRGRKKLAYQALRRVGLAHRMSSFPPELSGGEQQRVAIARALINEPDILIADEPTGNLDPDLAREILRLFLTVNQRGTTVLLATHDREMIQRVGGRVLTLDRGTLLTDRVVEGSEPPELRLKGLADGDDEGRASGSARDLKDVKDSEDEGGVDPRLGGEAADNSLLLGSGEASAVGDEPDTARGEEGS